MNFAVAATLAALSIALSSGSSLGDLHVEIRILSGHH